MPSLAQAIGQTLQRAGLSRAGAAGVLGNLQQESSINPNAPGGGLAQWIGPRQTALAQFAQAQGKPVNDAGVQTAFLVNELKGQYPGLYNALRTSTDPRAAALAFSQQYERPGTPMNQNRMNYAVGAYRQLGGQAPSGAFPATGAAQGMITVPTTQFDQAGYNAARARAIAGQAITQAARSPLLDVPGATKGFAQSLGSGTAPLFGRGLLTTTQPNPSDYTTTRNLQIATGQLQQLAGMPLVNVHAGAAGDINPIPGATIGRTDMGVDANLKPGSPILAPNNAKVVAVVPNWYAGQPYVALQLTSGPNAGKVMYVAEQISGAPPVGTTLRRGQSITRYAGSGTGIEIGWASPHNPTQTLAQAQGNTGTSTHANAPAGVNFRSYLSSFGA